MAMRHPRRFSSILALVLLIMNAAVALAQTQLGAGSVSGVVLDESGAGVPGATVTATNTGTAEARTTTTSYSGQFTIPVVPVGQYTVRVAKTGFASTEVTQVTVN